MNSGVTVRRASRVPLPSPVDVDMTPLAGGPGRRRLAAAPRTSNLLPLPPRGEKWKKDARPKDVHVGSHDLGLGGRGTVLMPRRTTCHQNGSNKCSPPTTARVQSIPPLMGPLQPNRKDTSQQARPRFT
nr:unnamed protein product [Digitaria exilis]